MKLRGQDPFTQARRLHSGRCPVHGVHLVQVGVHARGPTVACPRRDCDRSYDVKPGTALYKALTS